MQLGRCTDDTPCQC